MKKFKEFVNEKINESIDFKGFKIATPLNRKEIIAAIEKFKVKNIKIYRVDGKMSADNYDFTIWVAEGEEGGYASIEFKPNDSSNRSNKFRIAEIGDDMEAEFAIDEHYEEYSKKYNGIELILKMYEDYLNKKIS